MSKIATMMKSTAIPAISIITLGIGFKVSLWLKEYSKLSEPSFMLILIFFMIFSILLPRLNSLQSFSLTKGELVLRDIKETERSVKQLAKAVLDVEETSGDKLLLQSIDESAHKEAVDRLKKLTT
jgi:hypothetical protein